MPTPLLETEPGSFRDRTARVLYRGGGVYRGLTAAAAAEWERLEGSAFYRRAVAAGQLVPTARAADEPEWAAVLRHEPIPFISYPYEWCFGMLRDAARLQLELTEAALADGMILKDATPYNVQWRGSRPVFIDVPSIVGLRPGEPWAGYRQFCQLYLYPLLLQAYRQVPFQPWLRGRLDGIEPHHCRALLRWRDLFRPGVLTHVVLQAYLQDRPAATPDDVRRELRDAGFHADLIRANLRGLRRVVAGLRWEPRRSEWSGYDGDNSYTDRDRDRKEAFVRDALSDGHWECVWDLGCNTGRYARLAAAHTGQVIAFDADPVCVERLYRQLRAEGDGVILPLVCDLADASPGLGWRGRERRPLEDRGRPDFTLCLALLHHLVLGRNLPLPEVVAWLAGLTSRLVVEFVTRDDPMVRRLLRHKDDQFTDYDLPIFEHTLTEHFEVLRREVLPSGTRILYTARSRS